MRLAIVTKFLSPYRNPVFADLANRPGVDLLVLTFSEDQAYRHWNLGELYANAAFRCERLSHARGLFPVWRRLRGFNPDAVIIGGYDAVECVEALLYCKWFRKKAVLWCGTTTRSVRRRGIAGAIRKRFVGHVDSFLAYGTLARQFLVENGAEPGTIVTGYNTVDVDYFARRTRELKGSPAHQELRARIAPISLLFVGQLTERKGLPYLMRALQNVNDQRVGLVVLGDGPLRVEYELEAKRRGLRVFFEGFRSQAELLSYYAASDVFVFPTLNDVWGLVVNEAMASGLPVVVSVAAGASQDLVREGHNGWVVDPRNIEQLTKALQKLIVDEEMRTRMGEASARMIRQFTPRALADAILSAASLGQAA